MSDRTQEARERADVQADINVVLDTLLKADEIIEWYRRQTGGTRALAVIHAMDAMKRLSHEAAGSRPLYDCPDCAFTFGAEHTDEDGGYSCPQCLEASLRDEIASWKRLVKMKDDALERIADPHSDRAPADLKDAIRIAQGARDGTQWPTAFPTAPALLAARELLAVPFGPDTRWESEARPILERLADDHERLLQSVERKMARLRQAEEVLDGYECDLEDLKAKLHAKHDRVAALETALRDPVTLAQMFHETYEALAPSHGYRTRESSAVAWDDVPEPNRALMIETCLVVGRKIAALAGGVTEPDTPT